MWALFAILHLSNPEQRKLAIQSILAHHASDIKDPEFTTLTSEFQIPAAWIWEAKALLSRSEEDAVGEVQHLLRAKNWTEAHSVLCRTVGPQAVIEQDYATLRALLEQFQGRAGIEGWRSGGQIYEDFVALVQPQGEGGPDRKARSELVGYLVDTLPGMREREQDVGFEERVAIKEMSAVVAKAALLLEGKEKEKQGVKKSRILNLPLTHEAGLERTLELGLGHYKAVMAGGK